LTEYQHNRLFTYVCITIKTTKYIDNNYNSEYIVLRDLSAIVSSALGIYYGCLLL